MDNHLKKELEEVSPFLLKMKDKSEPYRVPDDFFSNLQDSVFAKLETGLKPNFNEEVQVPTKKAESVWQRLLTQVEWILGSPFSLSASAFTVVMLLYWWTFNIPHRDNCMELACVPDVEIQQYLEQHIDEIDTETLWFAAASENAEAEIDASGQRSAKSQKVQEASDIEVQQLLMEMIDNDQLNEEDLKDII